MRDIQSLPQCPIIGICAGLVSSRASRSGATLLGIIFILLGVTMVIEPRVLVALAASLFVLIGLVIILFVNLSRPPHPVR